MIKKLSFVLVLLIIASFSIAGPPAMPPSSGGSGVVTASDCSSYTAIGQLCQDTDDGKLYKGTGSTVEEIPIGTVLKSSGILSPGHLVGVHASDGTIIDMGEQTPDNATILNVLAKDDSGEVEDLTLPSGFGMTGTSSPTMTMIDRVSASFDGGGLAIAVNKATYTWLPFGGTITKWTVLCDQNVTTSGIDFYVYKDAYAADTLPTTDITGTGTRPNVASGSHKTGQGSTFTDWTTTTVAAGDMIGFKVKTAPTSATWCSVTLEITR